MSTAKNEHTGDYIKTKTNGSSLYAENWEKIFGKKECKKCENCKCKDEVKVVKTDDR